jgi:hypothetical protein
MPAGASQLAAPPRYDEWLDFFFGRFERDADDPWKMDWNFNASADEKAELFAATLNRCGSDLAACSGRQIAVGLQATWMGELSSTIAHDICGSSDNARLAAISSFASLYTNLLAPRSTPALGHLNECDGAPLSYVVYMAWDVSPMKDLVGLRDPNRDRDALIGVMSDILCSKPANPAVIESILHGFGHMVGSHPKYRDQIVASIDYFLSHRPITRPELKIYAGHAKKGYVQ